MAMAMPLPAWPLMLVSAEALPNRSVLNVALALVATVVGGEPAFMSTAVGVEPATLDVDEEADIMLLDELDDGTVAFNGLYVACIFSFCLLLYLSISVYYSY